MKSWQIIPCFLIFGLLASPINKLSAQCNGEETVAYAGQINYPRSEPLCNQPIYILNEGYNNTPNFTQWQILTTTDSLIYAITTNAYFEQGVLSDTSLLWGVNLHNSALPPQPGFPLQVLTDNTETDCIHLTEPVMVMPAQINLDYFIYNYSYNFIPVCSSTYPDGHVIEATCFFNAAPTGFITFISPYYAANQLYYLETQEKVTATYSYLSNQIYDSEIVNSDTTAVFYISNHNQSFQEGRVFLETRQLSNYTATTCSCLNIVDIPPASNCQLQTPPDCSFPGIMPSDTLIICNDQPEWVQTNDPIIANGHILAYVIHTGSGLAIGEIKGFSANGELDYTQLTGINYNQYYYVSAITGPDENGDGLPDLNHPCTQSNLGRPITFLQPITVNIQNDWSSTPIENCTYSKILNTYIASIDPHLEGFPVTVTSDAIDTIIFNNSTVIEFVFPNCDSVPAQTSFTFTNIYGCSKTIEISNNFPTPIGYGLYFIGMNNSETQTLCPQDSIQVQIDCVISNEFCENYNIIDNYDIHYFLTTSPYYNPALYTIISSNTTGVFYTNDVPPSYRDTLLYIIAVDPSFIPNFQNYFYYNEYYSDYYYVKIGVQPVVFLSPIQANAQIFTTSAVSNEFYVSLQISGGITQYLQSGTYGICNTDSLLTWNSATQSAALVLGPFPNDSLSNFQIPDLCLFESNASCYAEGMQVPVACCELMMQPNCSYPGTTPSDTVFVCYGETAWVQTQDTVLLNGDVLAYVLHTNPGLSLGSALAFNNTGVFDANQIAELTFTQTYYISAITGPDEDNDGMPDPDNPCTLLALGTPVVFLSDWISNEEFIYESYQFFDCGVNTEITFVSILIADSIQFPITLSSLEGLFPDTILHSTVSLFFPISYNAYQEALSLLNFTYTDRFGCTKLKSQYFNVIFEANHYALYGMPSDTLIVCPQDLVSVEVTCMLYQKGNAEPLQELEIQYFLTTAPEYNPLLYPIIAANTTGVFTSDLAAEYLDTLLYIVATDPEYEDINDEYDQIEENVTPIVFLSPVQASAESFILSDLPNAFYINIWLTGGSPSYFQQGNYLLCDSNPILVPWNNEAQNAVFTSGPFPIEILPSFTSFNLCVQDLITACGFENLETLIAPPCPITLQSSLSHCVENEPLPLSNLFSPPGGDFSGLYIQDGLFAPDTAGIYSITYCYQDCCEDLAIAVSTNANAAGTNNYLALCSADAPTIDLSLLLSNAQISGLWQVSPMGCQPPNEAFVADQGLFYPPQNMACSYCFEYLVALNDCPYDTAQICIETFLPPAVMPEQTVYILPDDTLTLGVIDNPAGLSFNWSNGETTAGIIVTLADTTLYTVTVTNIAGCTAQAAINLLPDPTIGMEILQNRHRLPYHIMPNPAQTDLSVTFPDDITHCRATVYDLHGKLLMQHDLSIAQNRLSVGHLPNGCYILHLADSTGWTALRFITAK